MKRMPTRTDWGAALAFYVGLGPQKRSYRLVAEQFGVSETTAKKHGDGRCKCCKPWQEIAQAIDVEAARKALAGAARTREQRASQVLRLVDNILDGFEAELDAKIADAKVSDLPGIVKLAELLEGEATERVDPGQVQQVLALVLQLGARGLPRERFLEEFDRAVVGVLGVGSEEGEAT